MPSNINQAITNGLNEINENFIDYNARKNNRMSLLLLEVVTNQRRYSITTPSGVREVVGNFSDFIANTGWSGLWNSLMAKLSLDWFKVIVSSNNFVTDSFLQKFLYDANGVRSASENMSNVNVLTTKIAEIARNLEEYPEKHERFSCYAYVILTQNQDALRSLNPSLLVRVLKCMSPKWSELLLARHGGVVLNILSNWTSPHNASWNAAILNNIEGLLNEICRNIEEYSEKFIEFNTRLYGVLKDPRYADLVANLSGAVLSRIERVSRNSIFQTLIFEHTAVNQNRNFSFYDTKINFLFDRMAQNQRAYDRNEDFGYTRSIVSHLGPAFGLNREWVREVGELHAAQRGLIQNVEIIVNTMPEKAFERLSPQTVNRLMISDTLPGNLPGIETDWLWIIRPYLDKLAPCALNNRILNEVLSRPDSTVLTSGQYLGLSVAQINSYLNEPTSSVNKLNLLKRLSAEQMSNIDVSTLASTLNDQSRRDILLLDVSFLNSIPQVVLTTLNNRFFEAISLAIMPSLNIGVKGIVLRRLTASYYNALTDDQMRIFNLTFDHFPHMSAETVSGLNANFFNRISVGLFDNWVCALNSSFLSNITDPIVIYGLRSTFLNALSSSVITELPFSFVNKIYDLNTVRELNNKWMSKFPRVVSVSTDTTYVKAGGVLKINVLVSDMVTVSGAVPPQLQLSNGGFATYESTTANNVRSTLVFSYTAVTGADTNGLQVIGFNARGAIIKNSNNVLFNPNQRIQNANGWQASDPLMSLPSVVVDTIAPMVTISKNQVALVSGSTALITFTLSEPSTNFVSQDVNVTGGRLINFTGAGMRYMAMFVPDEASNVSATISVLGNKFTDISGNANLEARVSYVVDTLAPMPTVLTGTAWINMENLQGAEFRFGFGTTGIDVGDKLMVTYQSSASSQTGEYTLTTQDVSRGSVVFSSADVMWPVPSLAVEGVSSVRAYIRDVVGNISPTSAPFNFIVTRDFSTLSSAQLNQLNTEIIRNLPAAFLERLTTKLNLLAGLNEQFFNNLNFSFIPNELLNKIALSLFSEDAKLNEAFIQNIANRILLNPNEPILTSAQIQALSANNLTILLNRFISVAASGQATFMPLWLLNGLSSNQVAGLNETVLTQLIRVQDVANLGDVFINGLAKKSFSGSIIRFNLSDVQIAALSHAQLALYFSSNNRVQAGVNVIIPAPMLMKLNASQIAGLSETIFRDNFPVEQTGELTQNFWNGVTPLQISYLSVEAINRLGLNIANGVNVTRLTAEQIQALKGDSNLINVSQLKLFFQAFYTVGSTIPYWILNALLPLQIRQLPQEVIEYCLPDLMSAELSNMNVLRIMGERSYAANILLLTESVFQTLLNNKLAAFLLPWVAAAQADEVTLPFFITRYLSVAQIENIATLYPELILKHVAVSTLTAAQLNALPVNLVEYLTLEWVSQINLQEVGNLSSRFLNSVSDDTFMFLHHDFISRINRSVLAMLSAEKIRIMSLQFMYLDAPVFTALEMQQFDEAQLLAVFLGSVICENDEERFADLTSMVGGLNAEKVRHVPWYLLQGTIHSATELQRLKGAHIDLDQIINGYADQYLAAKNDNENSWFLSSEHKTDNVNIMNNAIQQIKIMLFNADHDALKLLKASTINKLVLLSYSPAQGVDALDWDSVMSSPDYPIEKSVKYLLFSAFNILTKDKVERLSVPVIVEFGHYLKGLTNAALVKVGLNAQIQKLSNTQLDNLFNQWGSSPISSLILEKLSIEQIKNLSDAILVKIIDLNHIQNQSNHFLRGLGARAKLLGTTILNQAQINTLNGRQLREFLSAWQTDGIYTLPPNISGLLSSAQNNELVNKALKVCGNNAGEVGIEIDLGSGAIEIGDQIQLWVDGKLWQVFDAKVNSFAQLSMDLSQVKESLGKAISVRVLDKMGNLIATSLPLSLNLNVVQNVSVGWLNSLADNKLVGNLSHAFLENLPAEVLGDYFGISADFVNQISDFGSLSSEFLNKLPGGILTEIAVSQINLLSTEKINQLNLMWDTVFPQIESGYARFDNVDENAIEIALHLDQAVYLSDGKAVLQLVLNNGGIAHYISGSGTSVLVFKYILSGGDNVSEFENNFSISRIDMQGSYVSNARGIKTSLSAQANTLYIDYDGTGLTQEISERSYAGINPLLIGGNTDGVNNAERANGISVTLDLTGTTAKLGDKVELLLNGESFSSRMIKELTQSDISAGNVLFTIASSVNLEGQGHKVLSAQMTRAYQTIAQGGNTEMFIDTLRPSIIQMNNNISGVLTDVNKKIIYTLNLNDSVSNLNVSDFTISQGTIQSVTGSGRRWEVRVRAAENTVGEVQLSLLENRVQDSVGNYNSAYVFPAQAINTIVPETPIQIPTRRNLSGQTSDLSSFHVAALLGWMLTHGNTMFNPELPSFDLDNISNPVAQVPEVETVYRFNLGTLTWVMRTGVDGRTTFSAQGPCPLGEPVPVALDWEGNTLTLEDGRILNLGATVRNVNRIYGEGDNYDNFTNHHEEEVVIARTIDVFNFNIGDSVWEARVLENGEVALQRITLGVAPHADLMIREIDFARRRIIFADNSSASLTEARFNWHRAETETEIERGTTPLTPEDRIQAGVYRFTVGGSTPSAQGMPAIPGSVWELEVNARGEQTLTQRIAGLDLGMIPVRVNVSTGEVIFSNAEAMNIADTRLRWQNLNQDISSYVVQAGNYQFFIGTTRWHVAVDAFGQTTLRRLEVGEDFGVRPNRVIASTGYIFFEDGSFTTVNDRYVRFSPSPLSAEAALSPGLYRLAQQTLSLDRYGRGLFSVTGEVRPNETPVEVNAETGVITYLDGHTANMYDAGWVHEDNLTVARNMVSAGEYTFNVDGNMWKAKVSSNGEVELSEVENTNNTGRRAQSVDVTMGRIHYSDGSSDSILASGFNWRLSKGMQGVLGKEGEDWTSAVEIGGSGPAINNLYTQVYMTRNPDDEGSDGGHPPSVPRVDIHERFDMLMRLPSDIHTVLGFLSELREMHLANPQNPIFLNYILGICSNVGWYTRDHTQLYQFLPYIDYLASKLDLVETEFPRLKDLDFVLLEPFLISYAVRFHHDDRRLYKLYECMQHYVRHFAIIDNLELIKKFFIGGDLTQAYIDELILRGDYGVFRLTKSIRYFDQATLGAFDWRSLLLVDDEQTLKIFVNCAALSPGIYVTKIIPFMNESNYAIFPWGFFNKEKLSRMVPAINVAYFPFMNLHSLSKLFTIPAFVGKVREYIIGTTLDETRIEGLKKLNKEQIISLFQMPRINDEELLSLLEKIMPKIQKEWYTDIFPLVPAPLISRLSLNIIRLVTNPIVFTDEQIRNFSEDQIETMILYSSSDPWVRKLTLLEDIREKVLNAISSLFFKGWGSIADSFIKRMGEDIRFNLDQSKKLGMEIFSLSRYCQAHINDVFREIDDSRIQRFIKQGGGAPGSAGFEYLDEDNVIKFSRGIISFLNSLNTGGDEDDDDDEDDIDMRLKGVAHIVSSFSQGTIAHLRIEVLNRFALLFNYTVSHRNFKEGIPLPTVETIDQYEARLLNLIPITRLLGSDGTFNPDVMAAINSLGRDKSILLNRDVYSFLAPITREDIQGLSAAQIAALDLDYLNSLSGQGVNLSTLFESDPPLINFIKQMNKVVLVNYLKSNAEFRTTIQPLMTVDLWNYFGGVFFVNMITEDFSSAAGTPPFFDVDLIPWLNDNILQVIESQIPHEISDFDGAAADFARRALWKVSDIQLYKLLGNSEVHLFIFLNVPEERLNSYELPNLREEIPDEIRRQLLTKYIDSYIEEINAGYINADYLAFVIPYLSDIDIKRINSTILVKEMRTSNQKVYREEDFLNKVNIAVFYFLVDSFYGGLEQSVLDRVIAKLIDEVIFPNDVDKKRKFSLGVYQNEAGEDVAIDIALFDRVLGHFLDQFRTPLKPSFIMPNLVNQLMARLPASIRSTPPFIERMREWDHHAWSEKSGYGEINLLAALRKIIPGSSIELSDDASLPLQVTKLGFNAAWAAGYRGQGINIAVIDTGIDMANTALMSHVNLLLSERVNAGSIQEIYDPSRAGVGHGASVASMIVGDSREVAGFKLAGAAPESTLIMLTSSTKFMSAVNANVDIINMSSSYLPDETLISAAAAKGIIFVTAAGNDGLVSNKEKYYADWNVVVAGGSSIQRDSTMNPKSSRSGKKQSNFVLAPYDQLAVSVMNNRAEIASGTSLSAPLVSSALAIILSAIDQQYSVEKIREDGSMYYDEDAPGAHVNVRISRVDRAKLAISVLVNTANSFVPYEMAASEGAGASAGGGAGAPAGGGSGAASGRSLAEESASFDTLTNAMSGFVTEPSFDNQNGVGTGVEFSNQPVITSPHV